MGTRDDIVADIKEAFDDDLSDAVVSVTLTLYTRGEYDTATGIAGQTVLHQEMTRGIFSDQWQWEVFNLPSEPNSDTLIILQDELSFRPDIGTLVDSVRGKTRIIDVRSDPMNVIWQCKVRT